MSNGSFSTHSILFKVRKLLDEGVPALNIGYESGAIISNEFYDDSDNDDWLLTLSLELYSVKKNHHAVTVGDLKKAPCWCIISTSNI